MSSLFGVLNIGTTGMNAASFGTSVASNNASNVATDGYTRRVAQLQPVDARLAGGARAAGASRISDPYIERRLLGAHSFAGEASARASTLSVLDVAFADAPGNLGDALDSFQRAVADFATMPHERAGRQQVLHTAEALSRSFQRNAAELDGARVDANARILDEVVQVNQKLHEIAALGVKIAELENIGQEAHDFRDRRDMVVREVARSLPVDVIEEPDGRVNVMLAGSRALVSSDGGVHELIAATEPTSGDIRVYRTTAGRQEDLTSLLTSGTIGGIMDARDGQLATARADLDQLAHDVATAYNAVHQTGLGLDGAGARDLFDAPPAGVTGAAVLFAVSADVAGQPDALGAAQDALALPGDNRVALQLQALADTKLAGGGAYTASEGYGAMVADSGSAVRAALAEEDQAVAGEEQLIALRESVSGVSTDEEMVALMRFQRAYQASIQVIQVADEMLADLLSMRR